MQASLAGLAAWCGTGGATLPGLFLAGLAGGLMHCAPMCGGFVLGQVADRMASVPTARLCESTRLGTALLLPYHLGRLTTYATLGAVAASLGAALGGQPWLGPVSAILLLVGALLFAAHAAARLAPGLRFLLPRLESAPPGWSRTLGRLTRRVDRSRRSGGFLLGVLLGFLPCGVLYAALAVAAAARSPGLGALDMLAFGFGTMPSLIAVGLAGRLAGRTWQRRILPLAGPVMLANALLLAAIAWQRLAGMT